MRQEGDHDFSFIVLFSIEACQTRLEELCAVTSLQVFLQTPKIEDIIAINCVIKRLRRPLKHGIFLWRLEPPLRIAGISDASAPNKQSNFATEGIIVCLAEDRISKIATDKDDFLIDEMVALLGGKMHILTGSSQKAKRISHSTSHAETLSSAKAIPLSQLIALRLCEPEIVTRRDFKMHRARPMALLEVQESATVPLPVDSFIDCMDLWELACGLKGIPQDKSQILGVLSIREERRCLRLRRLFHIRTKWMAADQLTKTSGQDSKELYRLVSSGFYDIKDKVRVRQGFGSTTD